MSEVKTDSNGTYIIVESGDTLSAIAKKHNTTVSELARINHITNVNMIVIGQKIYLTGTAGVATVNTNQATILSFGLLSNSSNTLFASWSWTKVSQTESYQIKWEYLTEKWPDTWMVGNSGSISVDEEDTSASQQSTYNIPDDAITVRFMVKPVSKKKSTSDTSVYWQANWSEERRHNTSDNPPIAPPTPSVEFKWENKLELLLKLENLNVNATNIRFQVVRRAGTGLSQVAISNTAIRYVDEIDAANRANGYARYSCVVEAGGEYYVRARSVYNNIESDWSAYSQAIFAPPYRPNGFTYIGAKTKTSVQLEWDAVEGAKTYEIEYTTELEYFGGSNGTTTASQIDTTQYILTGLETGDEYFFRLRAVNDGGESDWSEISSVILGKVPGAPTTWSSSTTVITGEPLYFYWIHNSEDGSSQTEAELRIVMGGIEDIIPVPNTDDEDEKDKTSSYVFDTSLLTHGTTIYWSVRTRGVMSEYGEWSTTRTVEIFPETTLYLGIVDGEGNGDLDGNSGWNFTAFPMQVIATYNPIFQKAVGYYIRIISNDSYETTDVMGQATWVGKGEAVYSRNVNVSSGLIMFIRAGDVALENNVSYTLSVEVTMESGLTAENSMSFTTKWATDSYWPNAEVSIDPAAYTATILPYCRDTYGKLVPNHTLAVYRRNYDGTLTEIASGIDNDGGTHVSDPHPALDYARYRIVATSNVTSRSCFYDMPGVKMGAREFVLQWDEKWSNYDIPDEYTSTQPVWTGSMIKLPYNISVNESAKPDAEHVNYIGRRHPVSYYGTHVGESCSWSAAIPKSDVETLYALRRLARWHGNVYVREPSGIGYWATVNVSMSQKYRDLTIPVSLSITRVEGGV